MTIDDDARDICARTAGPVLLLLLTAMVLCMFNYLYLRMIFPSSTVPGQSTRPFLQRISLKRDKINQTFFQY